MRFFRNALSLATIVGMATLVHGSARAQTPSQTDVPPPEISKGTIGLLLDGSYNMHLANFQTLPDIPNCCPLFERGTGWGGTAGLFYDYDAFGDGHLGIRAVVNSLNGTLKADEPMTIAINGQAQQGMVEHTIDAKFTVASLEPYYALELGGFRIMAGGSVGMILNPTFTQQEAIIEPSNEGVFSPENTRTRNVISGSIPQAAKMRIGLFAGAAYPLPLNSIGTLHFTPEVLFDYGLTPMVSGLSWSISTLRAGASIGYTPRHVFEPPPPPPPPPPPVPPPPPKPALAVGIKAYTIINGVRDSSNLSVTVEEFFSTTMTPLLPFVLFGLDNANIPARYHGIRADQTTSFVERKTDSTDNVRVYHDLLNIIGQRMRKLPKARITLTGCTSNEPEELADKNLSSERANAVADYLKTVWNIAPNRISIQSRGLPEKPSSLTQPDGKEENRRVEIASTDPSILAPIVLSDTTLTTNPPMMQFVPSVTAQAGVKDWDLYATQPVMTLHHANGNGAQPIEGWTWDLRSSAAKIPRTEDTIEYGLDVEDSAGQEMTAVGTIPVRQTTLSKKRLERIADKIIERYTLVLFDFGASRIDPANQRVIDLIREQISTGTKATITGYADRSGEDALNLQLTQDRANAVAAMLGTKDYTAKGVGKSVLLFDNNIPEGRFYSRTVNIVLEKPINQ